MIPESALRICLRAWLYDYLKEGYDLGRTRHNEGIDAPPLTIQDLSARYAPDIEWVLDQVDAMLAQNAPLRVVVTDQRSTLTAYGVDDAIVWKSARATCDNCGMATEGSTMPTTCAHCGEALR